MRARSLSGAFPFSCSKPSLSIILGSNLLETLKLQLRPARRPDLLALRDGGRLRATRSPARFALLHAGGGHAWRRDGARDGARVSS